MPKIPNLFTLLWFRSDMEKVRQLLRTKPSELTEESLTFISQHIEKLFDHINLRRRRCDELEQQLTREQALIERPIYILRYNQPYHIEPMGGVLLEEKLIAFPAANDDEANKLARVFLNQPTICLGRPYRRTIVSIVRSANIEPKIKKASA